MQLVEILESLDNSNKNELENQIVSMGSTAVPVLVEQLQTSKGLKRGVVAMSLIRIGEASIEFLKEAANNNKDFSWIANYLINEISSEAIA